MPIFVAIAAAISAIAVVFVGAIWMLISALLFYILIALIALIAWKIGRNEVRNDRYLDHQRSRNRTLNDQEFAAWRDEVDRGRKSAIKQVDASKQIDREGS